MRYYVISYTHRKWVGKPDPSGFGKSTITFRDPSAAHEYANKLKSQGCGGIVITPSNVNPCDP